jgi:peptidyl-tRNA hydrolase
MGDSRLGNIGSKYPKNRHSIVVAVISESQNITLSISEKLKQQKPA